MSLMSQCLNHLKITIKVQSSSQTKIKPFYCRKFVIENLFLLFEVTAREHLGTRGTRDMLPREHLTTQGTLARQHVSTQDTLTRQHVGT